MELKRAGVRIAEVKGLSSLSMSSGVIDKTSFRTTGYREFSGSIVDGGTLTFTINFNYTLATHETLLSDLNDQAVHSYSLVFPDTNLSELALPSVVIGFEIVAELDSAVVATIALKITGDTEWGSAVERPVVLPSLALWLNAEDAGMTLNGASGGGMRVQRWPDAVTGSTNYAEQLTSSAQPILLDNQVNGRPTVRFDSNDKWMQFANTILVHPGSGFFPQAFTTFVVCSLTGYFHPFGRLDGASYYQLGATCAFQNLAGGSEGIETGVTIPAPMAIYAMWYDGLNTPPSGPNTATFSAYRNTTRVRHDPGAGFVASCSFETIAKYGSFNIWANADVGEILVYESALDLTPGGDFEDVYNDLADRWL